MKKLMCILLSVLMLCGCRNSVSNRDETGFISYIDDAGRELLIEQEINRIMPSGPISQIVLYALCPEMFVGLGSRWPESANGIIDEKTLNLSYYGQLYGSADLNLEMLSVAAPQLILDIGEYKDGISEDLDKITHQTGISTVFVDANLENMGDVYRKLGQLLHLEERAEELASFCDQIYQQTADIMNQVNGQKVSVLYCQSEDGLNVLSKGSYHAQMLDWLSENPAVIENGTSKGLGNSVSIEQILLWNPEVILFADSNAMENAEKDPAWNQLDAFKNNKVYLVPNVPYSWMGTPPSVQRYLGMIWLCDLLYPEVCDYDPIEQIRKYYQLFYHCELSDEDIQKMIN